MSHEINKMNFSISPFMSWQTVDAQLKIISREMSIAYILRIFIEHEENHSNEPKQYSAEMRKEVHRV